VWEFIYPIKRGDELFGFISVSGYKSDKAESYIARVAKKYNIPQKKLAVAYSSLKCDTPTKKWVDTLILPLCNMLELAYMKSEVNAIADNDPIEEVLKYIKRNHAQKIALEDVCKHFGYSRSYISHVFKKRTGQSFREYLTKLRLDDAESLLKYSNLTVTEIALSVGFSDSTYFSNVFKANVGISPSAYRKK
jgi:YesN/AraC family two-component response regulator